jgi:hypothetical protein
VYVVHCAGLYFVVYLKVKGGNMSEHIDHDLPKEAREPSAIDIVGTSKAMLELLTGEVRRMGSKLTALEAENNILQRYIKNRLCEGAIGEEVVFAAFMAGRSSQGTNIGEEFEEWIKNHVTK